MGSWQWLNTFRVMAILMLTRIISLPTIPHDSTHLDTLALYPFKRIIAKGVAGMMVAHLHIPAYDTASHIAATLSKNIVSDLLKARLGFQGLVFTDALDMKAVSNYASPGEVDLQALKAGNDILVLPENIPSAIQRVKEAIEKGELDRKKVYEKVQKILHGKYQMQLHRWKPIDTRNLYKQLHHPQAHLLKQHLFEKAITVVANKDHLIPIRELATYPIASLSITDDKKTNTSFLDKYASVSHYTLARKNLTAETLHKHLDQLKQYKLVIVNMHDIKNKRTHQFGLKNEERLFLHTLQENTSLIIVLFGNAYSLELFREFDHVVAAYEDDTVAAKVVPQIIFGELPAEGKLPITIPGAWRTGWGITTQDP